MTHKAIVAEVACSAKSKGKLPILGVLFDEVSRRDCLHCYLASSVVCVCHCARKYWEAESGKKGDRFDVEAMIGASGSAHHEMMLSRAVNLYESLFDNNKWVTQAL